MAPFEMNPAHKEAWMDLLQRDAQEASQYYFDNILPEVLDHLTANGVALPEEERPDLLVSLMGFSPETTVISAAMVRPGRLVVIYSKETEQYFDIAAQFLTSRKIIPFSALNQEAVNPTNAAEIYKVVYNRIDRRKPAIIDVTGGKKVMSATAAQVAWELGMRLCYIESDRYSPELRRPAPGSEQLIILPDPSQQRGRQARRRAMDIYASGNYALAEEFFTESLKVNRDNRLDELSRALCRCYAAWMDLDQARLSGAVEEAASLGTHNRMEALVAGNFPQFHDHLAAHHKVARGDRVALLATYLQLANLYREQQRHDFSCLLSYRSMEALVEEELLQKAGGEFDTGRPDYGRLGDRDELEQAYIALSRQVDERSSETGLPRKVGFIAGFALLCLLNPDLPRQTFPGNEDAAGALQGLRALAGRRNGSVLAHGHKSLEPDDSRLLMEAARRLARAVLAERYPKLEQLEQNLHPLALDAEQQ